MSSHSKCKLGLAGCFLVFATILASGTDIGAQAPRPLRIGVLTDMSSGYADVVGPGAVEAARLAIVDAGGAVLGRPIELVFADHQNKADLGAAIVRRWYDNEDVRAVFEVINSSIALAVQELARTKDRIVVFSGSSSTDLTNKACSPNGFQWAYDSYSLSRGVVPLVAGPVKTWYLLTVDYAAGHATARAARDAIEAGGGKVLGEVRFPLGTPDFSTFLLQAQASGAMGLAVSAAGSDALNIMKQAREFGVTPAATMSILGLMLTDIHAVGLPSAQGIVFSTAFYWDQDEKSREWSKRFFDRIGRMPTDLQASVYSSVRHYLRAVTKAGSDETKAVLAAMRDMPVEDFMTDGARIRSDGRLMRDMYVLEVKKPDESSRAWDYAKIITKLSAEQAFRPLSISECPTAVSK